MRTKIWGNKLILKNREIRQDLGPGQKNHYLHTADVLGADRSVPFLLDDSYVCKELQLL